jgi:hypothetical protein
VLRLLPGLPAGYARAAWADLRRRTASDSDDAGGRPGAEAPSIGRPHPHLVISVAWGFPNLPRQSPPSSHRRSCPLFLFLRSTSPFFFCWSRSDCYTLLDIRLLRHYSDEHWNGDTLMWASHGHEVTLLHSELLLYHGAMRSVMHVCTSRSWENKSSVHRNWSTFVGHGYNRQKLTNFY